MEEIGSKNQKQGEGVEEEEKEAAITLASLQKEKWLSGNICFYKRFWCPQAFFRNLFSAQKYFKASDKDLLLATLPKSGTTWLKALSFAIANRHLHTPSNHPLLTSNPHALVPFLEHRLYTPSSPFPEHKMYTPSSNTRILSTHVPYKALPESIKNTNCRIIYICRNIFDAFISLWHFLCKCIPPGHVPLSFEDAFNQYCRGAAGYGPFWDHILGYWNQSLVEPEKILFLMYEDLQEDIAHQTKRLADFIGVPFTLEEEREGVIDDIIKLCSFGNLSELEVNKTSARSDMNAYNSAYFRKGEVGDWVNHFSREMVEHLNNVIHEKLGSSGLKFMTSYNKMSNERLIIQA